MQKEWGYCRVSTANQHEDRQIKALLEYGIDERNIIVDKESGKDFNRLGYLSLKKRLLRPGDTLVIKELDRLGRNKAAVKHELEWMKSEGIRVKILDLPTTLISCENNDWVLEMVSSILIEVLTSVAQEEREKLHRRQTEGISSARSRGVVFGRPVVAKPSNYNEVMAKVDSGQLKAVEAMKELGLKKVRSIRCGKPTALAAD